MRGALLSDLLVLICAGSSFQKLSEGFGPDWVWPDDPQAFLHVCLFLLSVWTFCNAPDGPFLLLALLLFDFLESAITFGLKR